MSNIQPIFEQMPIFALVLFRIGGMMALAPLMGSTIVPVKVRLLLVLVLSFVVFPLVPPVAFAPNSTIGMALAVGGELLIGITMGFVLSLLFVGIQLGGEMVSQQMGLSMARMIDPMTEVSTTALSQFYLLLATLIYVLMNGHVILIQSLVRTFRSIPLLSGFDISAALKMSLVVLSEAFQLGIRIAGPALVALFLASLAMGFISRTMPQLNILAAGFPVRIALGLVLLIASLGTVGILLENSIKRVFTQIGALFIL